MPADLPGHPAGTGPHLRAISPVGGGTGPAVEGAPRRRPGGAAGRLRAAVVRACRSRPDRVRDPSPRAGLDSHFGGETELSPGDETALGEAVQLLHQRSGMGQDVCADVPVLSLLGAGLSESTPLASRADAAARDRLPAGGKRFSELRRPGGVAATGRLSAAAPDRRAGAEVAGLSDALLHLPGAPAA